MKINRAMQTFSKLKIIKIWAICFSAVIFLSWQSPLALAAPSSPTLIASIFSFSSRQPTNLGVQDGQLSPCPETPNCVSSQSNDSTHYIDPLTYSSNTEEAFLQLKSILQAIGNAEIVEESENYIYAQFTSAIMGFVDDVEFYLVPSENLIHVRSASRLGESDLGVNRKRLEGIRSQFNA